MKSLQIAEPLPISLGWAHHFLSAMRLAMLMITSLTDLIPVMALLPLFAGLAHLAYGGEQ